MSDSNSPSVIQDSVYTQWLSRDPDPKTREELQRLIDNNNTDELNARFSNRLEFGTAGLRGTVGAGPNRMNRLVIQKQQRDWVNTFWNPRTMPKNTV